MNLNLNTQFQKKQKTIMKELRHNNRSENTSDVPYSTGLHTSCKNDLRFSSDHSETSTIDSSARSDSSESDVESDLEHPRAERTEALMWGKVLTRTIPAATTTAPVIAAVDNLMFFLLNCKDIGSMSFGGKETDEYIY